MSGRHYSPIMAGEFDRTINQVMKEMNSMFKNTVTNSDFNQIKKQLDDNYQQNNLLKKDLYKQQQKNENQRRKQEKDLKQNMTKVKKDLYKQQQENENQRRKLEKNLKQNMTKVKKDLYKQQQENENQRRKLEKEFKQKINEQKIKLEKINQEHVQEGKKLENKIKQNITKLKKDYEQKIDVINQKAQKFEKEIKKSINQLNNKLKDIESRETDKNIFLNNQFDNIKSLNDYLKHLRIEQFLPEKYLEIKHQMDNIQNNINKKFYEAGIAISQDLRLKCLKIEYELELINERANYLEATIISNLNLIREFKNDEKFTKIKQEFLTDDGKTITEEIDVKYWKEESYKENADKYKKLKQQSNNIRNMKLDEIQKLADETDFLLENFKATTEDAVKKYFNHIKAMETQEIITYKLEDLGFELLENIHENDDDRKKNIALFENSSGSKIKIVINPENNILNTSFNNLNDIYHNEQKEAIEDATGNKLQDIEGYEAKPAPESDFELQQHTNNSEKHENS